jgi:glycosyltransferase involved in cell wall biosynthesis
MPAPVLLDITPLDRGHANRGIGTAVRGLVSGLAQLSEPARPALLARRDQPTPDGFAVHRVPWPRWPLGRIPDPWPHLTVERTVRRLPFRLFHATQADFVPARRDRPLVATCYDLIPLHMPLRNPLHRHRYATYLARLRAADRIVTISQATADDLEGSLGIPRDRIRVAPLGLPATPEPHGPTPSAPYVLYANSIEPHKNPHLLVAALRGVPAEVELVMCGLWSTRRRETLEQAFVAQGLADRVHLLGHVPADRLAALRRDARAVLIPSRLEGFGLPVLEALAAGTPVLAADIPALHEAGGDLATYVPVGDIEAWAQAITRVAADDTHRRAVAERGPMHAATFTWDRTATLTASVWREVLDG